MIRRVLQTKNQHGMANAMNSASNMELSLKDNGIVVDMSPAAMLQQQQQQQQQQTQHAAAVTLRNSFKESSSPIDIDVTPEAGGAGMDVDANITPTNLSTTQSATQQTPTSASPSSSAAMATFHCERCDNFETTSRASLLLHVVQCLSSPARLKADPDTDVHDSLNVSAVPHMDAIANGSALGGIGVGIGGGGGGVGGKLTPVEALTASNVVVAAAANGSASSPAASSSSSSSSSRKVFECDVCNMKFSNGANMRRHKMRHTGVKPYECRVCQKRFFRKDHLAEHFTTHTKTLPYHCPICNRGFQRQIAMRAHFQNEHVGQHDLVKTCPLCSYRAGSMKSLRIHFFNRHGIDLDNPGPGGTSSLLLALESQASQVAAVAAAASFVPGGLNAVAAAAAAAASANAAAAAANNMPPSHHSDSGESLRSMENATPPMHFLTPHVEISTLSDNGSELFNGSSNGVCVDSLDATSKCKEQQQQQQQQQHHQRDSIQTSSTLPMLTQTPGGAAVVTPPQDQPMDCNTKTMPSSTSNSNAIINTHHQHSTSPKSHHYNHDNHITPSISLIPIKQQEPYGEDLSSDKHNHLKAHSNNNNNNNNNNTNNNNNNNGSTNNNNNNINGDQCNGNEGVEDFTSPHNRLTSLIKVSPLKSLLREDLKRRICAKANNRITRSAAALENNNVLPAPGTGCGAVTGGGGSVTTGTGVTGVGGGASVTNSSSPVCNSTPICNGTITSTGQDADATMLSRKQILTCLFCGIEFPDETLYFLHKGCHCESNPWKCNICGEQCNNVYEFNSHLLSKSHQ